MVLPLGDLEKTRIVPWVTYGLIVVNILIYMLQLKLGLPFEYAYAATPYEISHNVDLKEPIPIAPDDGEDPDPDGRPDVLPEAPGPYPIWLTLFTAMFLHGSPLHLAGNMLYLWIFGDNVEEVLGSLRYLLVYLACGLIGSIAQIVADPNSLIPTLGASGAIAGVMGMYVIWFPHNRVRVLVFRFVTEMPALLAIGLWILLQLVLSLGWLRHHGSTGGVAYLAHVGGAATGLFAAYLFRDLAAALRARNAALDGWFYGP